MNNSIIVTTFLPILIAAIMFGLGLALTREDFVRVWKMPKAVIVGLAIKLVLLPSVAFALCLAFSLGPEFAVGLMMVAAAPSSAVANVFSRLAKADVALSLCLTAIDNLLTAVTLPLFVALSFNYFMGASQNIGLQGAEAVKIFGLILFPVLAGMAFRHYFPKYSGRVDKVLRVVSILVLIVLVAGVFLTNRELLVKHYKELTSVVVIFNLCCFLFGCLVAKAAGLSTRQCKSVSMAMGIQGTALVATIAITFLGQIIFAMPAAFFSLSMYLLAGLSLPVFSRLK
jgi:BASS family bile acid:Na+ symporter